MGVSGGAGGMDPFDQERLARAVEEMMKPLRPTLEAAQRAAAEMVKSVQLPDVRWSLPDAVSTQLLESYEQALAPLRDQLAAIDWAGVVPKIDPAVFARLAERIRECLPPNWRDLEDWFLAAELVAAGGWAIVWLPRTDVVRELLDVPNADRPAVLLKNRDVLLEDAEALLAEVTHVGLAYLAGCALEATQALQAGLDRPAQALLGSTLTGILQGPLEFEQLRAAREAFSGDWEEAAIEELRFVLVTSTIPQALSQFYPHRGDPVPDTFNRHAIAHKPDPVQYTEFNALLGLMLVVALLRELQERAAGSAAHE